MGVELFHADGHADMTKLALAFRNFAKTPENVLKAAIATLNTEHLKDG
jgi:hypothetical protein